MREVYILLSEIKTAAEVVKITCGRSTRSPRPKVIQGSKWWRL